MFRRDINKLTTLVEQGVSQPADARLRTPGAGRFSRVIADLVRYGPNYAAVNFITSSPKPIEPETIWRLFTRPRPAFIDAYPLPAARRRLIEEALQVSHARGIEYHYDLSNDFYRLFLDHEHMLYSCADFASPADSLETAQTRKVDFIVDLIDPKAGEDILEIGCGWGGMLRAVSARTAGQVKLTGYTLSHEQARHVRETLGHEVLLENFLHADLGRDRFDAIYGVAALEHVKPEEIGPLYAKFHAALKPGGRMVQHYFSLDGDDPWPASMITAQLFFPGSNLSTQAHHLACLDAAGFRLEKASQHDYRPTLRAWFDRLVANKAEAIDLVGQETTQKYLAFFAASWDFFNRREATLHRLKLIKDR
ncbi:MAG: class I SAM-dependent methyltransferase [Pseudomonadota bacterium]